jgi:hypothetical protein
VVPIFQKSMAKIKDVIIVSRGEADEEDIVELKESESRLPSCMVLPPLDDYPDYDHPTTATRHGRFWYLDSSKEGVALPPLETGIVQRESLQA